MNKEEISSPKLSSRRSKKKPQIKSVAIFNTSAHTASPHVLDLKEHVASLPASLPTQSWQPNTLHKFLAHPTSAFKKTDSPLHSTFKTPVFKTSRSSRKCKQFARGFIHQIQDDARTIAEHIKQTRRSCIQACVSPFRATHALTKIASANTHAASTRLIARAHTLQEKILTVVKPKTYFWTNRWFKTASAFVATALLIIIPVKTLSAYSTLKESRSTLQTQSVNAFQSLKASGDALLTIENNDASGNIQTALTLFNKANGELAEIDSITRTLLRLSPSRYAQFETGSHILRAGALVSRALLPLTTALTTFKHTTDTPLTDRLLLFQKALKEALPSIAAANIELRGVKEEALPAQYRTQFLMVKNYLTNLENDAHVADPLFGLLYEMLGGASDRRYLVVFQNNTEMRATGGFIGSFALLDIARGELKQIRFPKGGSYDLQGNLKIALEPPAPLKLLRTKWEFQDANWFPDFPASARKLAWFYEKSGGATVDGVIALDTTILVDLLKLTGPLAIPAFNKTVSADNAIVTIQTEVEMNYDHQINEPKRFLGAVIEEMIKKIKTDPANELSVLSILQNNLAERHLQLMSFHDTDEQSILEHDWGGALKDNAGGDYLAVINTNIGGQKTDGVITQKTRLQTTVQEDGSIINTLTIERAHHGTQGQLFYGVPNIDYARVLVPQGSMLINATGFSYPEENMVKTSDEQYNTDQDLARVETEQKIDEASGTVINTQFNKTSFANWIITKPGETSIATITYRLPFNVFTNSKKSSFENFNQWLGGANEQMINYSLLVQKQAGMVDNNFTHRMVFPNPTEAVWMTPTEWIAPDDHSYKTEIKSAGDIFNGFIGRIKK
ncbi:MAG: DUF4012 domain-containing protein [Candidatus Magasanikbacteria bacterium]|nr:DUF4012 domain-containing protein [Candidatus Magasanikbacteria bacterium]